MNQTIPPNIAIKDFMRPGIDDGLSIDHGRSVYTALLPVIQGFVDVDTIHLSMKGIREVNSSFCREAIVRTICEFRGKIGFCLVDIENEEYLDNFVAAAIKLKQPVFFKLDSGYKVIGPAFPSELPRGAAEILDYVKKHNPTTATMLKSDLDLSITNASTKLKQLLEQGYLLRKQEAATSGGLEFKYFPIQ